MKESRKEGEEEEEMEEKKTVAPMTLEWKSKTPQARWKSTTGQQRHRPSPPAHTRVWSRQTYHRSSRHAPTSAHSLRTTYGPNPSPSRLPKPLDASHPSHQRPLDCLTTRGIRTNSGFVTRRMHTTAPYRMERAQDTSSHGVAEAHDAPTRVRGQRGHQTQRSKG